jgi:alkaline phosphatase D
VPAAELLSLSDYRTRHAQYRTDPALQAAHAAFPWLMTWDDHEFEDNYANLDLDPDQPLEAVAARRAAAYLAYWEHTPLARVRKPVGKDMALYRRAQWGDLATFHVLDTRQHRSDQFTQCPRSARHSSGYCPDALDPARSILGAEQRDWLLGGLGGSDTSWNVLANQIGFAPIDTEPSAAFRRFAPERWDGYVHDRQLVLDALAQQGRANTVVITGDSHENSVRNVPRDFNSLDGPPIATEFLGTSISSEGDDPRPLPPPVYGGDPQNPQLLFTDYHRGYVRVTLDSALWTNEFRVVDTVRQPVATASTLETFVVQRGVPGAQRAGI